MPEFNDVAVETAPAELTEDIAIEDLTEVSGAGTTNCGGTFGTATCPSCLGTSFSFT